MWLYPACSFPPCFVCPVSSRLVKQGFRNLISACHIVLKYRYIYSSIAVTKTWQSRVEIKGYSIAYFDCIAVFEVPYR